MHQQSLLALKIGTKLHHSELTLRFDIAAELLHSFYLAEIVLHTVWLAIGIIMSEMLSPRGHWPRGQNFGLGLGLGLKALASPRPWPQKFGLSLASVCRRRTSSQEEIDWPICLPTTGHHTVTEDKLLCEREWEIKLSFWSQWYKFARVLSTIIWHFLFITLSLASAWPRSQEIGLGLGLDLKALASASGPWPRPRSRSRVFGLI